MKMNANRKRARESSSESESSSDSDSDSDSSTSDSEKKDKKEKEELGHGKEEMKEWNAQVAEFPNDSKEPWSETKLQRERKWYVHKPRSKRFKKFRQQRISPAQIQTAERQMLEWLKTEQFHFSKFPVQCPEPLSITTAAVESSIRQAPPDRVRYCETCREMHVYFEPKKYRAVDPPPDDAHAWRWVKQNSSLWDQLRKESDGASSAYTTIGWCEYRTNVQHHGEATGSLPMVKMNATGIQMCGHGHRHEDKPRRLYSILLNVATKETGYWMHPDHKTAHASPDGFSEFPDTDECIHPLIFNDSLRSIHEIKCSIFGKYMRAKRRLKLLMEYQAAAAAAERKGQPIPDVPVPARFDGPLPTFIHRPQCEHVIQMQYQGEVMGAQWNDYINMFVPNPLGAAVQLDSARFLFPFVLDEAKQAEFAQQAPPGSWLVGELTVTRVYQNEHFGDELMSSHLKHLKHVHSGRPPKLIEHMQLPSVSWLPLLHAVFLVTGSPSHLAHSQVLYDLQEIMPFVPDDNSNEDKAKTSPKPAGWRGEWPPRIRCLHQTFEHVKMQHTLLPQLKDF